MSDLVEWLLQILDEDEKASRNRWTMNPLAPPIEVHYGASIDPDMVTVSAPGSTLTRTMTAEEYQRSYLVPAPDERMLADIAAKRAIIAVLAYERKQQRVAADDMVIRVMATAYAARPGYRNEWWPDEWLHPARRD